MFIVLRIQCQYISYSQFSCIQIIFDITMSFTFSKILFNNLIKIINEFKIDNELSSSRVEHVFLNPSTNRVMNVPAHARDASTSIKSARLVLDSYAHDYIT